jgi:hypothetical protein
MLICFYLLFQGFSSKQPFSQKTDFLRQPENATVLSGKRLLLKCRPNLSNLFPTLNKSKSDSIAKDDMSSSHLEHKWYKDNKLVAYNSRVVSLY